MSERSINPKNIAKAEELTALYASFKCVFVVKFAGVTVDSMNKFRKAATALESNVVVVKNSLNSIVASKLEKGEFAEFLSGQNLTIFTDSLVEISQLVCKSRRYGFVPIVCLDEKSNIYKEDGIVLLSKIPPLPVLQSNLLSVFTAASRGVLSALLGNQGSIVRAINAFAKK